MTSEQGAHDDAMRAQEAVNEYGEVVEEAVVYRPLNVPSDWPGFIQPCSPEENREMVKRIWIARKGRSVMWPSDGTEPPSPVEEAPR